MSSASAFVLIHVQWIPSPLWKEGGVLWGGPFSLSCVTCLQCAPSEYCVGGFTYLARSCSDRHLVVAFMTTCKVEGQANGSIFQVLHIQQPLSKESSKLYHATPHIDSQTECLVDLPCGVLLCVCSCAIPWSRWVCAGQTQCSTTPCTRSYLWAAQQLKRYNVTDCTACL